MPEEITIPILQTRLEGLEKEAIQLKDKLKQNEEWRKQVSEELAKIKRIIGVK